MTLQLLARAFAAPLLFALASASPARGTWVASPQEEQQEDGTILLSLSDIVLDQYRVQHVDPEELWSLADGLGGRRYYVREHGANAQELSSMRLLGDAIVLYDTKEQVQRMREMLARLDAPQAEAASPKSIVEYRPRFVSLDTLRAAVRELVHLSVVEERSLIVLHDRQEKVDAALALLKRIDVPEKQVLITCQLVEVGGADLGTALPKELLDNLQRLLPGSQFSQAGMAMLKTSVSAQASLAVQIDTREDNYQLAFTPVSFDEASGALTIAGCTLVENEARELFRTNTVLRAGEYTVLAATGETPKLLVVRVTPQG